MVVVQRRCSIWLSEIQLEHLCFFVLKTKISPLVFIGICGLAGVLGFVRCFSATQQRGCISALIDWIAIILLHSIVNACP